MFHVGNVYARRHTPLTRPRHGMFVSFEKKVVVWCPPDPYQLCMHEHGYNHLFKSSLSHFSSKFPVVGRSFIRDSWSKVKSRYFLHTAQCKQEAPLPFSLPMDQFKSRTICFDEEDTNNKTKRNKQGDTLGASLFPFLPLFPSFPRTGTDLLCPGQRFFVYFRVFGTKNLDQVWIVEPKEGQGPEQKTTTTGNVHLGWHLQITIRSQTLFISERKNNNPRE